MTTNNNVLNIVSKRPIVIGLVTVVLTVAVGAMIAFSTGLTTPSQVLANVVPPCCTPPPPPPPPPLPPPPPPPPVPLVPPTCELEVSPSTLPVGGGEVTITWKAVAASDAIIQSRNANDGVETVRDWFSVDEEGSLTVNVIVSTLFRMTVSGPGGKSECDDKVIVPVPLPPDAPVCTLVAAPTTIAPGGKSTLTWTTENADTFTINRGIGAVIPVAGGNVEVSPTATTNYKGTATGNGITVECDATVTVTDTPPPAPVCTLEATPTIVIAQEHMDYNDDGKFGSLDGLALFTIATGNKPCPAGKVCDVNDDGNITASDALIVEKYAVGIWAPGQTMLSWTTTNGVSFSIDQGIGSVIPVAEGLKHVPVTQNTTFTGTVTNSAGITAECSAPVRVLKPEGTEPQPIIPACTLAVGSASDVLDYNNDGKLDTADAQFLMDLAADVVQACPSGKVCDLTGDGYIDGGDDELMSDALLHAKYGKNIGLTGTHTLVWTTDNASSFVLNQGIGNVIPIPEGSTKVSPTQTTTYVGVARSRTGHTVECRATIEFGGGGNPLACTLTASPKTVKSGEKSTLTWTTNQATSFTIDQGVGAVTPTSGGSTSTPAITSETTFTGVARDASGNTVSCSDKVTIESAGCTSDCGSSGGGGGSPRPRVVVSSTPNIGEVAGSYIYLSQVPYTGLDLGPVGTAVYWIVLIAWSALLAYIVLFNGMPALRRSMNGFGSQVEMALNAPRHEVAAAPPVRSAPLAETTYAPEAPHAYSTFDGFKSFGKNESLSIEDIVKGLTRAQKIPTAAPTPKPATEPVYDRVEPIYEHVEPIEEAVPSVTAHIAETTGVSTDVRGFTHALLTGDREGVFAGLRQYVRGGGSPETLISQVACLLDDAYRARVEGSACDPDIARQAARLNTTQLEKLVTSLTTAIDSSYSVDATGAKLALTRALAVVGA